MKVIIIEDEILAQAKLEGMLQEIRAQVTVVAKLGSVKETLAWLASHEQPDLAFVDIQLSDDHSFEIFRRFPVQFPVVFTTAFDKYLLESFEFNSIDYILKPVTQEKLRRSLEKHSRLEKHFLSGNIQNLVNIAQPVQERIIARKGTDFVALGTDDIAYFFTEHRIVFVKNKDGQQFIVDKTLGELEGQLDPLRFFRINRKFISHINSIERFKSDHGKIRVFLKPEVREEVHVSKETAPEFRKWIGKK